MSYLKNLQNKPGRVKERYALLGALTVTFVVGAVWTTTLPARLQNFSPPQGSEVAADPTQDTPTFSELMNSVRDQTSAISDAFNQSESSEDSPNEMVAEPNEEPRIAEENVTAPPANLAPQLRTATTTADPSSTTTERAEPRVILIGTTTSRQAD